MIEKECKYQKGVYKVQTFGTTQAGDQGSSFKAKGAILNGWMNIKSRPAFAF
jgi:hypothetical protein